jgi:hypothetical protein
MSLCNRPIEFGKIMSAFYLYYNVFKIQSFIVYCIIFVKLAKDKLMYSCFFQRPEHFRQSAIFCTRAIDLYPITNLLTIGLCWCGVLLYSTTFCSLIGLTYQLFAAFALGSYSHQSLLIIAWTECFKRISLYSFL